jgi:hypothetical protein
MSAVYNSTVQGFYLSYYGRPADPAGLTFWTGQLAAAGGNLSAILDAFGTSAEATRRYGTGTNASKIEAIYQQTFGRAADPVGLAFYEGELAAGRMTLINASKRIIDGAAGDDITIRTNRLSAAQSFTDKLDTDAEKAGYSGSGAEDAARAWITTVTKDAATVTAAVATADATISGLLPQTFTLTTNADTFTGASGNDKVSGVISGLTTAATLNATDKLDGGAGTDSLSLSMAVNWGGNSSGFIKNIETINLTNTGTTDLSFDATGTSGVTEYGLTVPTLGNFTITNAATGLNTISLSGMKSATGASPTLTTSFVSGAAEETRTTDVLTLKLNDVGNATAVIGGVSTARNASLSLGSFETVNIEATGANTVAFTGANTAKTYTAKGSGSLTIASVQSATTDVDVSALTGKFSGSFTANTTGLKTIKTGSADDTVSVGIQQITGNAVISGGAGADVLNIRSSGAAGAVSVELQQSGFETVNLQTVADQTLSLSGAKTTDVATITHNSTTAQDVSFVSMGASNLTFISLGTTSTDGTSVATTANNKTLSSDHSGTTQLTFTAASKSVTDKTAQLPTDDYSFTKTSGLTIDVGQFVNATGASITANKATSVTLNIASGKNDAGAEQTRYSGALTAGEATSITINATGAMNGMDLSAAKATSVSITNGGTSAAVDANGGADPVALSIGSARTLSIASGHNFTTGTSAFATDVAKVQTLSLTANARIIDTTAHNFAAVSSVTLSGAGTSSGAESQIKLANLGTAGGAGTGNAYNLSVVATGLKGNLTIGDLDTGAGYDITVDAKGVTGNTTITNALGGTTSGTDIRNLSIDATGSGGTLTVSSNTTIGAVGDISILAGGAAGAQIAVGGAGAINGANVTVDVSNTTAVSDVAGAYTIGSSLNLKTHALAAADTYTIGARAGATTMSLNLTTGINVDTVVVNGVAGLASITASGDLGSGADAVTISNNFSTAQTVNISALANYDKATIITGAASDTITGGSGADTIIAGRGTNTMTGGGGADIYIFNVGDSTYDATNTITDFSASQVDKITYGATNITMMGGGGTGGAAGTAYTYTSALTGTPGVSISTRGVATFSGTATAYDTLLEIAAILSEAANTQAGSGKAAFFRLASDTAASYLFISDGNTSGTGDTIVRLVGVSTPASGDAITLGTGGDATATGIFGFGG